MRSYSEVWITSCCMYFELSQLRLYANELGALLSDPSSLDQLLLTLPADIQTAIRGFLDGDLSAVRGTDASLSDSHGGLG